MAATTGRNMIIVFETLSEELPRKEWEITMSNPAYWELDGVRGKFDYVYAPSYPSIEQAYLDAGKEIYRPQDGEQEPSSDKKDDSVLTDNNTTSTVHLETEQDTSEEGLTQEDFTVEDVPLEDKMPKSEEEIDNMEWLDLRKKAVYISPEPVKSKKQAQQVLKDWLKERS